METKSRLRARHRGARDRRARVKCVDYEGRPPHRVDRRSRRCPAVRTRGNRPPGAGAGDGDLGPGSPPPRTSCEERLAHVITHVCLESHGAVAVGRDNLTAWVSTQGISAARDGLATGLNIPQANVRVITQYMGGGFGSKMGPDAQGLICARLAKEAKAPVKLMLDRKEEHLVTGNRPSATARVKAGVGADGKVTAFDAESWGTGGAGAAAGFPLPYIYQFPNRRRAHKDVFINTGQQRPMRAPGHPQGSFITEVLMEELADKVKMDPIEFRIKNLPAEAPNAMWASYLRRGATEFGWDKRHRRGSQPRPIKTGWAWRSITWGGGGRPVRRAPTSRSHRTAWSCALRHAGSGHRHAHDGRRHRARPPWACGERHPAGDRRHDAPISGARAGARPPRRSVPRSGSPASMRSNALKARVEPVAGGDGRLARRGRRPHPREGHPSKGMSWADPASSSARSRSRSTATAARALLRDDLGRAVSPTSRSEHRDAHRQRLAPGLSRCRTAASS